MPMEQHLSTVLHLFNSKPLNNRTFSSRFSTFSASFRSSSSFPSSFSSSSRSSSFVCSGQYFGINPGNVGYQMLSRIGWDEQSGLGPESHPGRLAPVPTQLFKERQGLGLRSVPSRITHFPGVKGTHELTEEETAAVDFRVDREANRQRKKAIVLTRNEINRKRKQDKQKEMAIREELNGPKYPEEPQT
jgi:hypothetical protein